MNRGWINLKRYLKSLLVVLWLVLMLIMVACNNNESPNAKGKETEVDTTSENKDQNSDPFPITTTIEGKEINLTEKPHKIAALSLNVAEVVMDLNGPESIVTVTDTMEQENLSHFSEEAKLIKNKIKGATSLDPETVLSYDPDLILLTLTHGAEEDANEMLMKARIPLASFNRWTTIQDVMDNYKKIGQLIGEEEKAFKVVADMQVKIDQVQKTANNKDKKPTVLMLSQVGSNTGPYILGPSSIAYDLIELAGGKSGSDVLELDKTSPASIEHIIEIDPDYIILVEWSATSDEFTELIESDGFQSLAAVKNGNVKQMKAKDISQPNRFIVEQLDELADWLNKGKH